MKRRLILTFASTFALQACAIGENIDVAEWTEETMLSNGSMIHVQRQARRKSGVWLPNRRGPRIDQSLIYRPLGVHWSGIDQSPISFDVIDGSIYLALHFLRREQCNNKLGDDYPVAYLKWVKGEWIELNQAEFPIEIAGLNLAISYWGRSSNEDYRGQIAWSQKSTVMKVLTGQPADPKTWVFPTRPGTIKEHFTATQTTCQKWMDAEKYYIPVKP
ncbi:hypothetical protein [Leptothrix ochracea]|uniref:hypothetical protein n=1 Tax=Leptothrix ochracea TaxID=735331 RepID=UPI0034E21C75